MNQRQEQANGAAVSLPLAVGGTAIFFLAKLSLYFLNDATAHGDQASITLFTWSTGILAVLMAAAFFKLASDIIVHQQQGPRP